MHRKGSWTGADGGIVAWSSSAQVGMRGSRSRSSQTTMVPCVRLASHGYSMIQSLPIPVSRRHSPWRAISARSQRAAESSAFAFLVNTVSRRQCASDAVFNPMPKRPKSCGARSMDGPPQPRRMASTNTSGDIPMPSSASRIRLDSQFHTKATRTSREPAEMLLSMRSAMLAGTGYPTPRKDPRSAEGWGGSRITDRSRA